MSEKPRRAEERITQQQVGDETLLYDERRHVAFCLNASAGAVWRLADGTRTELEIAARASASLEEEMNEGMVRLAVEELEGNGLMEVAAESAGAAAHADPGSDYDAPPQGMDSSTAEAAMYSRRTLLARLGVGAAALIPAVAFIVAPTAAQAYSGCVDCSVETPSRASPRRRKARGGSLPGIAPAGDPSP